jgi:hypothetical protein
MRRLFWCKLIARWWLHDDLKNCLVGVSQGCTFCAPHSLYENLINSQKATTSHHCLYILQAIIVFSLIIICKQGGISFRCTHSVMSVQAFDSMQNQSNKQSENSYFMIFDPAQPLQQRPSFHLPLGTQNKKLILKCKL